MKPEHKDFVNRLNEACDHHPDAPPPYRGRQRWLSKVISVSPEASRKWFAGEARPRPPVMKKIAEALKVDEGWLALGLTPIHEPSERKVAERRAGGAIYYIAGLIEMEGGTVAFPEGDDADAGVDLFATVRGRQRKLHVAPADRVAPAATSPRSRPTTTSCWCCPWSWATTGTARACCSWPPTCSTSTPSRAAAIRRSR